MSGLLASLVLIGVAIGLMALLTLLAWLGSTCCPAGGSADREELSPDQACPPTCRVGVAEAAFTPP